MKLKEGFILHDVGNEHMVVATGEAAKSFNGMVRNNDTANFIFRKLMTETTQEQIAAAMAEEYDAPRELIDRDVEQIIAKLRKAGFLDE